jgi:hypothetical protein
MAELKVTTAQHAYGLLGISCDIGALQNLTFMLNTGRGLSYLSVDLFEQLQRAGNGDHLGQGVYRVREFALAGCAMPNLFVRVSAAVGVLGFSGFLGLQFLKQLSTARFDRDTGVLTLTD